MSRSGSQPRSRRFAPFLGIVPLCVAVAVAAAVVYAGVFANPRPRSGVIEDDSHRSTSAIKAPDTATLPAAQFSTKPLRGLFPAVPIRVIDGDTVEMRVSIWLGQEVVTRVRMRGIDAPELRARCEEELNKAEAAKQLLASLLGKGDVFLSEVGYDKYGTRVVARIVDISNVDIGLTLIERGLARYYTGGKRESWCADAKTGLAQRSPPG